MYEKKVIAILLTTDNDQKQTRVLKTIFKHKVFKQKQITSTTSYFISDAFKVERT